MDRSGTPEIGDADRRARAARRLFEERGIGARVEAVGVDGEIAAVRGPAAIREAVARAAPAIRALGFRYVALELDGEVITQRNA